jgi:DUF971 family protein
VTTPWPAALRVRRAARVLEIDFDDGSTFTLNAALLRAMTPSAAERGHGSSTDQPIARDFTDVRLLGAVPVGAYAVRLVFDDGHDSGLYTWTALHRIGTNASALQTAHRASLTAPKVPIEHLTK